MSKFKVGDEAKLCVIRMRSGDAPDWIQGAIVKVIEVSDGVSDVTGLPYEYAVMTKWQAENNMFSCVMGWQLEPLTPDLGSWEEIARTIKWKPEGVTA